jgi:prepilin-type N-terminal cleavage/methylation domain-containing protein
MNATAKNDAVDAPEAGFTLVEVLVAIVVLVFGLIAVTNLLLVGASNNTAANLGTAATVAAVQQMENLKAQSFLAMTSGSNTVMMPGAGPIQVTWTVAEPTTPAITHHARIITVTAQGTGPMVASRSRTVLTGIRSCVGEVPGCPAP